VPADVHQDDEHTEGHPHHGGHLTNPRGR
jgi:hypothetical protein